MAEQVRVEDLEVFRLFRVAMLKFGQAAGQSLSSADGEIARTLSWLEGEQSTYWRGQLRKRSEAVVKAREEVRKKKLYRDFSGRTHNAAQEEKVLAQCQAAVNEAEEKIVAIRKCVPKLQKEAEQYRGGVSRISDTVMVDVPKAVALLDRLATTLEEYLQIESPAFDPMESVGEPSFDETMSRGNETVETPPKVEPAAEKAVDTQNASASPADVTNPKEGRDVAHGQ